MQTVSNPDAWQEKTLDMMWMKVCDQMPNYVCTIFTDMGESMI